MQRKMERTSLDVSGIERMTKKARFTCPACKGGFSNPVKFHEHLLAEHRRLDELEALENYGAEK